MAQTTFEIATSADDGMSNGSGAVYATQTNDGNFTGETTDHVVRRNDAGTYRTRVTLLRWDTSIIGLATITSAQLVLYPTARFDGGDLDLVAEWYAYDGSPSASDFTVTPSNTAHAGTDISGLTLNAQNTFELQNLGSIFTGPGVYTGLRLHLSDNGAPALNEHNQISYSASDHASDPGPQLIVNYSESFTYRGTPRRGLLGVN